MLAWLSVRKNRESVIVTMLSVIAGLTLYQVVASLTELVTKF